MTIDNNTTQSHLETEPISKLLISFCVPSLASSIVTSVYNIVDQLFVGNALGIYGNAATNVVFPVITLVTALSLMCGVGPSAAMNISLGQGDSEGAAKAVGGGFGLMVVCGLSTMIPMLIMTEPLLRIMGCTETVMPYALPYARIISLSFVFSILSASGVFLVRADGSPKYALTCITVGSVLNVVLDALFIYVMGWGIAGAAWATLIAQVISAGMVIWYMLRFKTLRLSMEDFYPNISLYRRIAAIGAGPAFNFLTQALVQIFLNNALRTYGSASKFGSDTCLAVAGVANKVNMLWTGFVVGLTNGLQPISSYNYGRKNYNRVIEASKTVIKTILAVGIVVFIMYQLIPDMIVAMFGAEDALCAEFAKQFFRTFFLLITLTGLQSSVAGFFSSQGKVSKSIIISLVRQVVFLPPLLIILPEIFGLRGVLWAGPLADLAMAITASILFVRELHTLRAS